jgi:endonuclease/exonuclease/phosphatase family metal-dependent hydrolase
MTSQPAVTKPNPRPIPFVKCLLATFYLILPLQMAALSEDGGHFRVMTYNADEGTDYLEVQNANSVTEFLLGVGQIITNVRATNPPARMQAIARQILLAEPDLVSLQELSQWSSGPFNPVTQACGPVTLEFDMLQELLNALAQQGGHYKLVVEAQQLAVPPVPGLIPPGTFLCAQVTNHIALLARTDRGDSEFVLSNVQAALYHNLVSVPTPVGPLPSPRAWASVDVTFKDKTFRFIGTHLESVVTSVRELQGAELRNGPASTSLPVVLAMDSNSQAFPMPRDPTYTDFLSAGFLDVWTELNPFQAGLTCCQAPLVNNPVSQLLQRTDLILTRGPVKAQDIRLYGADLSSRTPGGLWPSDHAAVAAQLAVFDEE